MQKNANFNMTKCIFISPHFDDICFSMDGLLQNLKEYEKTIINVFTKSCYIRRMLMPYSDQLKRMELISEIRKNEDAVFCDNHNISQINLGFFEASTKSIINKKQDNDLIYKKLIEIINFDEEQLLFIPMGIGNHEDHLQIFDIFKNIVNKKTQTKFIIYEDLPYAHVKNDRYLRIGELSNFLVNNGFKNYRLHLNRNIILKKRKDIMIYESQHKYKNHKRVRIGRYLIKKSFLSSPVESFWLQDCNVAKNLMMY